MTDQPRRISAADVWRVVSRVTGVTHTQACGPDRDGRTVLARQLFSHVMRTSGSADYIDIANFLGRSKHNAAMLMSRAFADRLWDRVVVPPGPRPHGEPPRTAEAWLELVMTHIDTLPRDHGRSDEERRDTSDVVAWLESHGYSAESVSAAISGDRKSPASDGLWHHFGVVKKWSDDRITRAVVLNPRSTR